MRAAWPGGRDGRPDTSTQEIENMNSPSIKRRAWIAMFALAACAGGAVSASAVAQDASAHGEDSRTCAGFGAPPGSRDYSKCMLSQQQRRDYAPLNAAEAQRLSAEAARNNVETVRRMRCEREARKDRDAGMRPGRC
jgi:hypothetical protein